MLPLVTQYGPYVGAGVAFAIAGWLAQPWLKSVLGGVLAAKASTPAQQPAVKASDATDPATLCEQASSIWRQRGEVDLATEASAVAIKSARKEPSSA